VYATVQDRSSRRVANLTQDDFTILDNGKEQPITLFSNDILPFSVVLMLDHSGSMFEYHAVVRAAAAEFVRHLLPHDQARMGSFGGFSDNRIAITPLQFTSDKNELLDALRMPLQRGGPSPLWASVDRSISALTKQEGRRVVLVFSDGYNMPDRSQMGIAFKDVVTRARATNTMVYALGFARWRADQRGRTGKVFQPHQDLRKLADDSGGGYVEVLGTSDLLSLFTRVADELHQQYWLGFAPSRRDGKTHEIRVRVNKKDLTVRARQSYVAPASGS
jgi:VWFA-related protein